VASLLQMMRVLIYAGLCEPPLSDAAVRRLRELGWKYAYHPEEFESEEESWQYGHGMVLQGDLDHGGKKELQRSYCPLEWREGQRHDPLVLQVFDEMGQDMFTEKQQHLDDGRSFPNPEDPYPSIVQAIEIPDGTEYEIYQWEGGWESIHEKHRVWGVDVEKIEGYVKEDA